MQMSNIILPQKENIDLDTFPSLTRIQYLHVNNKPGHINIFIIYPYGVQILSFLLNFNINLFFVSGGTKYIDHVIMIPLPVNMNH